MKASKIYFASDHGGFGLKGKLLEFTKSLGYSVEDLGPEKLDPSDDYPIFAKKIAERVAKEPESLGVILCRNGVGISVACNKVDGARCALSWNSKHASSTRKDDNANVISIPADYVEKTQAEEMLKAFFETEYVHNERFDRRLNEIKDIESSN